MQDPTGESLKNLLSRITQQLLEAGIDGAETDAELISAHVLGVTRGRLQALGILDEQVADRQVTRIQQLADDRAQRVPLQHLTGRAPFRELELFVGPGVFVPRPETETVAQFAIDALAALPESERVAVDLCTGSGAIALSLAHEVAAARVWAIEKSVEAHAWAGRNVQAHGDDRVHLLLGDAAAAVSLLPAEIVGLVPVLIANPPYVPSNMVPKDPEVRDHDPEMALYSGDDGLDLIRVIGRVAREIVKPGGLIVLEHAELQGPAIRHLLTGLGWNAAATHPDLTGRDRATTAIK